MADQTNPYTQLGMMGMMMPNPYTQYGGKPLPIPGYMGAPTDAQGNPIQSFTDAQKAHDAWAAANPSPPGTTLNSAPSGLEAQGSQARAMQNAGYGDWAMLDPTMAASNRPNPTAGAGSVGATSGWNPANPTSAYPTSAGGAAGSGASGSGSAVANPIDMRQAYLTALSNPGKVTTPGANVPQAQPLGSPSVMNAFLAANPSGGSGAGGYNNTGFFNTLNKLRAN